MATMASSLALSLTLLHLCCVTTSSPLGPPGSEDPGKDYAIPHHTTNHYIISKLKSFYSYLFNKPESVHEDGYTKVHVMGKHMYYTYTHEFTQGEGQPRDAQGQRVTEDAVFKEYVKNDDLLKQQRENVQEHIQRQKQLEEEARERLKQEADKKELEEGILKKALRNIPILKRFVRDVSTPRPPNGLFKEGLKKIVETVWGEPHSKVSENLGKKLSEKICKAGSSAASALSDAKVGLKEGVKSAAKGTVNLLGQMLIPRGIREGWPDVKNALGKMVLKAAEQAPILHIFIPGPPPDYWPNPPPRRPEVNIIYPI